MALGLLLVGRLMRRSKTRPPVSLHGDGHYAQTIVGEHHHHGHLGQIGMLGGRGRHRTTATLILERYNRHDRMAVSVWLAGDRAGHLARDQARVFRSRYAGRGRRFTCPAAVSGLDGRGQIVVRLDLPPLDREA